MANLDAMLASFDEVAKGLPEVPNSTANGNGSGRNNELTSIAGRLAAQGRDMDAIRSGVFEKNAQFGEPLTECEIERTVLRSAAKWEQSDSNDMVPEHIADSDIGNSIAYAHYVTGQLLWDGVNQQWWWWSKTKWVVDTERRYELFLKPVTDRLFQQGALLEGERRERRMKFLASRLKPRQAHVAMIEGAKPYLPISPTDFDAEPSLLAFNNGILDLLSGEFSPPDSQYLNSKSTGYDYNPEAGCPYWLEFLNQICQGDQRLIRDLQLIMGESLSGDTGKSLFIIYWGEGANGKSTVLKVHGRLLGDYATHTKSSVFAARDSEHVKGWDVFPLVGARLVTAIETDSTKYLNESTVKNMTGDDRMRAEKKYAMSFEFEPTWLPIMATNSKPRIRGANDAIWRRLRLVEFNYVVPEENRVKGYADNYLLPELAGIFNWAHEGFKAIQTSGTIQFSERVTLATQRYRDDQDVLAEWLAQRTEQDANCRASLKDAYNGYKEFTGDSERALGKRAFQEAMEERGFRTVTGKARARFITGVKLVISTAEGEF